MVKKIISLIVSTRLTAILFITFSAAMGIGTFIESMHGTDAARILIYNAFWFELMMVLFLINFIFNIKRYNLLSRPKLGILLMHLSWILIIIGAGVTRYIGYEGVMPIREGNVTNEYLSSDTYLTVLIDGEIEGTPRRRKLEKKLLMSEYTNNSFLIANDFNKQKFEIEYLDFKENVELSVVESDTGSNFIKIVEASSGERHDHYIEEDRSQICGVLFSFNNYNEGAINFINVDDDYSFKVRLEELMRMIDQKRGDVKLDQLRSYNLDHCTTLLGYSLLFQMGLLRDHIKF